MDRCEVEPATVETFPGTGQPSEVDAGALVARLAEALAELAATVDGLGVGLGPTLAAAAAADPALLVQAQALDAVSQSLHGLAGFLCRVGERRVGREPLHLEALAAALPVQALSDRMSGAAPGAEAGDAVFF